MNLDSDFTSSGKISPTDETYEFLKRFWGLKQVDNCVKAYKIWQSRLDAPRKTMGLSCSKRNERRRISKPVANVECFVSHRETVDGDVEYFCKWQGLNYDHCTWELQKEINLIAKEHIATYRKRPNSPTRVFLTVENRFLPLVSLSPTATLWSLPGHRSTLHRYSARKLNAQCKTRTTNQKATMELKEGDVRVLIRSMQRWGDICQRFDVIVRVAL